MNILAINGSPRSEASNSWKLAKAFIKGIQSDGDSVCIIDVSKLDIRSCLGCFSCWARTPGKCCISDDMAEVIEARLNADIVIWSFPLYYYTVPGKLKTLIDRQLPMVCPTLIDREDGFGSGSHPARYDLKHQRNVVVSTCGFWSAAGNYDGVDSLFSHMCGKNNYESIYCGEGELFRVKELSEITCRYLETVTRAGREYINGGITPETCEALNIPLLPKDIFEKMANASW